MSDDAGFISHDEFKQLYPQFDGRKLELVVLAEEAGEFMWEKDGAGWWRLESEPREPR